MAGILKNKILWVAGLVALVAVGAIIIVVILTRPQDALLERINSDFLREIDKGSTAKSIESFLGKIGAATDSKITVSSKVDKIATKESLTADISGYMKEQAGSFAFSGKATLSGTTVATGDTLIEFQLIYLNNNVYLNISKETLLVNSEVKPVFLSIAGKWLEVKAVDLGSIINVFTGLDITDSLSSWPTELAVASGPISEISKSSNTMLAGQSVSCEKAAVKVSPDELSRELILCGGVSKAAPKKLTLKTVKTTTLTNEEVSSYLDLTIEPASNLSEVAAPADSTPLGQ